MYRRLLTLFRSTHEHCWHPEEAYRFDVVGAVLTVLPCLIQRRERGYSCCVDGCAALAH